MISTSNEPLANGYLYNPSPSNLNTVIGSNDKVENIVVKSEQALSPTTSPSPTSSFSSANSNFSTHNSLLQITNPQNGLFSVDNILNTGNPTQAPYFQSSVLQPNNFMVQQNNQYPYYYQNESHESFIGIEKTEVPENISKGNETLIANRLEPALSDKENTQNQLKFYQTDKPEVSQTSDYEEDMYEETSNDDSIDSDNEESLSKIKKMKQIGKSFTLLLKLLLFKKNNILNFLFRFNISER